MIVSWSDDEGTNGDGESDVAKRVTAMTGRVESESESGDEDPIYDKVIVPYYYQDINDADTFRLLIEQEEIINHL
jgi:plasmid stabilization system protein ParE